MELFCKASSTKNCLELIRQGVEVRMIGDRSRFFGEGPQLPGHGRGADRGGTRDATLILALNYFVAGK